MISPSGVGVRSVVVFCRKRGCRPTTDGLPCSRCDTFQRYGHRAIEMMLRYVYRKDALFLALLEQP